MKTKLFWLILLFLLGATALSAAEKGAGSVVSVSLSPTKTKDGMRPEPYLPLQVGNKWWYDRLSPQRHMYVGWEVTDSMTINNHLYYHLEGAFSYGHPMWCRNEGDSLLIYDELDLDSNPETLELVLEDFTQIGEYHPYHSLMYYFPLPWQTDNTWICSYFGEWLYEYLGAVRQTRCYSYVFPGEWDNWEDWYWTRGIGVKMISAEDWYTGEDITDGLVACIVGGVMYGDTTGVAQEELPPVHGIEVSVYPNPFTDRVNVHFSLPKDKHSCTVTIVNVKGQVVRRETVISKDNWVWDGNDAIGTQTSGIYFVRVEQDGQTVTRKIARIR